MTIAAFGQASSGELLNLEKKYNLILPEDYKKFLVNFNGGDVKFDDTCGIYVTGLMEKIHVDILLGIDTGNCELDIDTWTDDYQHDMYEGMLIIGHSYEHGFIIIQCSEKDPGIYYWDHSYEFKHSNDESNTYFIAGTFTEFMRQVGHGDGSSV